LCWLGLGSSPLQASRRNVVVHYKKNAVKKIIILFIFSISFSFGQNIESEKINEIDSICKSINKLKKVEYKTLESSGLITKKKLLFFKKNIGSFNEDVIYVNNKILKITHVEFLNGKVKNERYYFSENNIIKYEIRTFDENEMNKTEINSVAYFDNGKLIKFWSDKETEFDALEILKKANQLNSNYLELQKIE